MSAIPKRKREKPLPTQGPPKKKDLGKNTAFSSTGGSYAIAVKNERIAILPKAFPKTTLAAHEQMAAEELIVEEIFDKWEDTIQFTGIHFRPGLVLFEYQSALRQNGFV